MYAILVHWAMVCMMIQMQSSVQLWYALRIQESFVPKVNIRFQVYFLKSDLTLELAKGAVLSAFTERDKFPILPGVIESYDEKEEYNLGSWEGNPLDCFSAILCGN